MCEGKVFLPESMTWPAHVAHKPFEQPEVYLEQSIGGAEMRALLCCQVRCHGQPLCLLKLACPLTWQRSSIGNLSVVLGDSAFDLCEVLCSVAVAVENCQNAWGGIGVIKADMYALCVPWCTVTPCSQGVCDFM